MSKLVFAALQRRRPLTWFPNAVPGDPLKQVVKSLGRTCSGTISNSISKSAPSITGRVFLQLVGLGGFGGYFEVFSMRQAANVVGHLVKPLPTPDAAPMPKVELSGFVAVSKKGHPLALPPPQATRPSPRSGLPAQRVRKQVTRTFGP